jgi:hypothetical protein
LNSISIVVNELIKADAIFDKVKIYSDSTVDNSNLQLPKEIDSEWKSVDTLQTIRELSKAKYFVGTNSKVSLWVAIFRLCLVVPGDIYLPINIAKNLSNVLNLEKKNFRTYSNIE